MGYSSVVAIALVLGGMSARADEVSSDDWAPESESRHVGCNLHTLRGGYGFHIQGTRPSGPGGPIESVIGVGIVTFDGEGNFKQVGNTHGSVSGSKIGQNGWGTYELNADCTGAVHLHNEGVPFVIDLRVVVTDNGLELQEVTVTDTPPVIVSAVLRKIHVRGPTLQW